MNILAADIGGTSSRFAHFQADPGGELTLLGVTVLKTKEAKSFAGLMDALWATDFTLRPKDADMASLAVAGPVRGTYSDPPNIDWDVDLSHPEKLGLRRAVMINDFVAQAYACLTKVGDDAQRVLEGEPDPMGAKAVIGPGTGFGKAALIPMGQNNNGGFLPMPSEGGHSAFPFKGDKEQEFSRFLIARLDVSYPSIDNVVTGGGMALLHEFLTGGHITPHQVPEHLEEGSETLLWSARMLARVARDFALDTLCTGGLFIAGGVAARSPALVRHEAFGAEFRDSQKHAGLLERIPVSLITDEASGLWGAAMRGLEELKRPG